jgi:phospholipase/carboxylesterase
MIHTLDGPRRDAESGPARSLVVFLHGYGASGDDLIELASMLSSRLPHTAFAAPHAVEEMPYPGQPAYQWFPLTQLDPEELAEGTRKAAPALEAFLSAELKRHQLPASRLALVGFSQGTMMALHVGLRLPQAPAAIVGLSGVIAGAATLAAEIKCRPPVMLSHGADDDVIPAAALHLTREALAACGVPVEWHVREGLGHGIDEAVVAETASFLRQWLG